MQTSFANSLIMAPYYVGEVQNQSISQRTGHLAGEVIPFGSPLYYDNATSTVKKMAANGTNPFFGIAARVLHESVGGTLGTDTNSPVMSLTTNTAGYAINDVVSVLKMGTIVVNINAVTDALVGVNVFWKKTDATLYAASANASAGNDILIGNAIIKPVVGYVPITLVSIPQV